MKQSILYVHPRNGAPTDTWSDVVEITQSGGDTILFKTKKGYAITVSKVTDWVLVEKTDETPTRS